MLKKEYDVFIAYHGSYKEDGSRAVADKLYEYLTEKSLHVFYFPMINKDSYKLNIIDVMKSKVFLLVANESISVASNGHLSTSDHYELSTEIDAFYALTQTGNDVSVTDSKVLVCGDYYNLRKKGDESNLHELFANRTHYYYLETKADPFAEVYDWILTRLARTKQLDSWNDSQVTTETTTVFSKKAGMSQQCNLSEIVANSEFVYCIGISNSDMTSKMNPAAIKHALANGATIEIVFLDPNSEFTANREKEENLRKDKIKKITEVNIDYALDVKYDLDDAQEQNYHLYTYRAIPRQNMIITEKYVILQYYANNVPGLDNPCFFIKKQDDSPVYDACLKNYNALKEQATEIEVEE